MSQWSAGLLPAPFNAHPGFKQLERAVNDPATSFTTVTLSVTGTAVYANNAAALAAGLVAGQVYRTATGQLMVTF